ncbi:MAG: HlyD family efflux transporter periplasmic adaptor subunit [Ardenticatenaceae bacterium]|nr:HlyD family efflux transporter periplasmic adaptor subunit [Ardenticatenaceae bacterium]
MNEKKRNKKWLWISGTAVIVVILIIALPALFRNNSAQADVGTGEIVTAFLGDLSASATASGQVEAQREAALALPSAGEVADVYVAVGDAVQTGDSLVKLDTADLERNVVSAQQSLAIQEANLATLTAPASDADIAAAEAAVASAQASLQDLLDGPSQDQITAARADVNAAQADVASASTQLADLQAAASDEELLAAQLALDLAQQAATSAAEQHSTILVTEPNQFIHQNRLDDMEFAARTAAVRANANLASAQEAYDTLVNGDPNSIAAAQASLALAVASRDAAQIQLDMLTMAATDAEIASAEASVASAAATLDQLQRGPSDYQVTQAEVAVEQAQIGLQQAEQSLADATLTAPFDGVVTAVHVNVGEMANGILVEMVDPGNLEVVLAVDEVDVGSITIGQPATITLETWPDETINGQVTAVAPQASNDASALVTYDVFLGLGETDLPILVGMTADAKLETADLSNVLLVPNAAVNVDRTNGQYSVNLVTVDGSGQQTYTETAVTVGLHDAQNTQIVSGLNEGDQLLVGEIAPVVEFGPGRGGPPPGMGN